MFNTRLDIDGRGSGEIAQQFVLAPSAKAPAHQQSRVRLGVTVLRHQQRGRIQPHHVEISTVRGFEVPLDHAL